MHDLPDGPAPRAVGRVQLCIRESVDGGGQLDTSSSRFSPIGILGDVQGQIATFLENRGIPSSVFNWGDDPTPYDMVVVVRPTNPGQTGFLSFLANPNYVECSNNTSNTTGACPGGTYQTGPVLLYLQQAGVNQSVRDAGTQEIPQTELAVYVQDTWKPNPRWTLNYGLRWEAQLQPDPITPPSQVFFQPFIGATVTNSTGTYRFPSDGTIPSDTKMFQPRLGFAFDPQADGRQVIRGSVGVYYARIPGLNLASSRSTNGSNGFTHFRGSVPNFYVGPAPAFGALLASNVPQSQVIFPDVFVFDEDFRNPRTLNATIGYERQLGQDLGLLLSYTHTYGQPHAVHQPERRRVREPLGHRAAGSPGEHQRNLHAHHR